MKTKYKILISTEIERLEKFVEHDLEDGWQLCGGLSVSQCFVEDHIDFSFAQAMIRRVPE